MPRAHDLLRLESPAALAGDAMRPDWVGAALKAAPWVVVRRAPSRDGRIPVGVRGAARDQRWAGWVDGQAITACLSPESLPAWSRNSPPARMTGLPALAALDPLAAILAAHGLAWGPTGSVGFELATGAPTVTETSDLDVLIRCDLPLARGIAVDLAQATGELGVRCDLLLETPAGGVALLEYARAVGPVAARGANGPRLVDDPWAEARIVRAEP